jgi:hypothetical protein
LEITAPGKVSAATINRVLASLGLDLLPERDFRRFRLRLFTRGLIDLIEFLEPSRLSERLSAIKKRVEDVV